MVEISDQSWLLFFFATWSWLEGDMSTLMGLVNAYKAKLRTRMTLEAMAIVHFCSIDFLWFYLAPRDFLNFSPYMRSLKVFWRIILSNNGPRLVCDNSWMHNEVARGLEMARVNVSWGLEQTFQTSLHLWAGTCIMKCAADVVALLQLGFNIKCRRKTGKRMTSKGNNDTYSKRLTSGIIYSSALYSTVNSIPCVSQDKLPNRTRQSGFHSFFWIDVAINWMEE